jgi:flagellar hook-associated protein FlgK
MSATSELLAEQVRNIEEQIVESERKGVDCSELIERRNELAKKLSTVNSALNEGKQILKG